MGIWSRIQKNRKEDLWKRKGNWGYEVGYRRVEKKIYGRGRVTGDMK